MADRNVASYLPGMLGPVGLSVDGVDVTPRTNLKFEGVSYSDDSGSDASVFDFRKGHGSTGLALADGNITILVADGDWRYIAPASLSGNRILKLSATGAKAGDQIEITRLDVSARTYAINDDASSTTLVHLPPSGDISYARFQFNGTNWMFRAGGRLTP